MRQETVVARPECGRHHKLKERMVSTRDSTLVCPECCYESFISTRQYKRLIAEGVLEARKSQGEKMEWIKCSERMPGIGQMVLVTNSAMRAYEVAIFDTGAISGKPFFGTSSGKFSATHWLPLPSPPVE